MVEVIIRQKENIKQLIHKTHNS